MWNEVINLIKRRKRKEKKNCLRKYEICSWQYAAAADAAILLMKEKYKALDVLYIYLSSDITLKLNLLCIQLTSVHYIPRQHKLR